MNRFGRAVLWNLVLVSVAFAGTIGEPVGVAGPPAQAHSPAAVVAAAPPKAEKHAERTAPKARAKRKKKKASGRSMLAAVAPNGAVSAPEPGGHTEAKDLADTAERIQKSWLLASAMGPPAMGVAVATLSAVTIGAADPDLAPAAAAEAPAPAPAPALAAAPLKPQVSSVEPPVWDSHLPTTQPASLAVDPTYRKVRVFGHVAANHWQGERNVGARAGPRGGTTNIWDAAIGVETRLSPDMELRVRALSILPAVSADGDGAGAGFPGGAVNFKDYLYMRDIYLGILHVGGWRQLNLRFGRVPIAFGDEYKQYDAPDNPLVSHSVPFFWGFDEGLQIYGDLSPDISYQFSTFLDGEIGNGADERASKAFGARIEGNHKGGWHWSASYYDNGETGAITQLPSLYFGRELAAPVGATGAAGGASRSASIRTEWWEGDFRYTFKKGYLALARGGGNLHDDNVHDREFEWFKVEPLYAVARKWDLVARYSGMNVKNAALGYRFNSFETVGTELNFDVNERQRLSVGTRYRANESVSFKLERTIEQWKLIPTALIASRIADPEHRDYTVLQAAVSF